VFFVTDVLYNWISQFKINCKNVWRINSFSKLLLKRLWQIWPRWSWPLPQRPQNHWVPLLPRTDVLTKFDKGRSRRSWVIDQKQKCYRRMYRPTARMTCAKQYALSSKMGGIIMLHATTQNSDKNALTSAENHRSLWKWKLTIKEAETKPLG